MNWYPETELRTWGTGDNRVKEYAIWLKSQNPLPAIPATFHPMFAKMVAVLREMHTFDENTLRDFRDGTFSCFGVERQQKATETRDDGRALIRKMLHYTGEVDETLVDNFYNDIGRYFVPFA